MHALTSKRARSRSLSGEANLALAALIILVGASVLRFASGGLPSLVAIASLLAPGLVFTAFLPQELRAAPISWLLVPTLGCAVTSILLITASAVGLALTPLTIYLLLIGACTAGLVASVSLDSPSPTSTVWDRARQGPEITIFMAAILLVGIGLEARAIGGTPLPGADWAHYLLYSTEISHHHTLLLDNPYWMFGHSPFAEDPGAPSLYGAYLTISGQGPALLYHGIWLFAVLGIVTMYVFVRTLFGDIAGIVAAAVLAVAPLSENLLTWHGLAEVYVLMYIPMIFLAVGMVLRGVDSWRWAALLGVLLVALAAGHRLSFLIVVVALVPPAAWIVYRHRGRGIGFLATTLLVALASGLGVALYLVRQADAIGGLQSYRAYLATKINGATLELVANYLTWPLIVAAALAVMAIMLTKRLRTDPAAYVPLFFLLALALVGFSWIVHFPTEYARVIYYLPIPVGALIGIACAYVPSRATLVAAALLIAWVAALSNARTEEARKFFTFVDPASERGLAMLDRRLDRRDVVAADRCWSFVAPWSLRHRVLAGLDPSLNLAGSDARPSAIARTILQGTGRSVALAARYRVRYALIDPLCANEYNIPPRVPTHGTPIYESTHLVIIRF